MDLKYVVLIFCYVNIAYSGPAVVTDETTNGITETTISITKLSNGMNKQSDDVAEEDADSKIDDFYNDFQPDPNNYIPSGTNTSTGKNSDSEIAATNTSTININLQSTQDNHNRSELTSTVPNQSVNTYEYVTSDFTQSTLGYNSGISTPTNNISTELSDATTNGITETTVSITKLSNRMNQQSDDVAEEDDVYNGLQPDPNNYIPSGINTSTRNNSNSETAATNISTININLQSSQDNRNRSELTSSLPNQKVNTYEKVTFNSTLGNNSGISIQKNSTSTTPNVDSSTTAEVVKNTNGLNINEDIKNKINENGINNRRETEDQIKSPLTNIKNNMHGHLGAFNNNQIDVTTVNNNYSFDKKSLDFDNKYVGKSVGTHVHVPEPVKGENNETNEITLPYHKNDRNKTKDNSASIPGIIPQYNTPSSSTIDTTSTHNGTSCDNSGSCINIINENEKGFEYSMKLSDIHENTTTNDQSFNVFMWCQFNGC